MAMRSQSQELFKEKVPPKRQLMEKIEVLEADKLMLESEVELHKTITHNSAEIVHVMTSFFSKSFKEMLKLGFDLT